MSIRERLEREIEKFKQTRGSMPVGVNELLLSDALEEIKRLTASEIQRVGWIRDRLPEPGTTVLAWWDFVQEKGTPTETNFAIAHYNGHYWHAADDDEDDYRDPIAWMPLPEGPNNVQR
jgi:hypothetical protein